MKKKLLSAVLAAAMVLSLAACGKNTPASTETSASTDTTWCSTAVAEVNKFKNFFNGTTEYLITNLPQKNFPPSEIKKAENERKDYIRRNQNG